MREEKTTQSQPSQEELIFNLLLLDESALPKYSYRAQIEEIVNSCLIGNIRVLLEVALNWTPPFHIEDKKGRVIIIEKLFSFDIVVMLNKKKFESRVLQMIQGFKEYLRKHPVHIQELFRIKGKSFTINQKSCPNLTKTINELVNRLNSLV